uniref:MATH domain-containing protein n=1 Tax=Bursaphelenchus xylophilus TaxID=6326 RepID=A0A1I7SFJ7_BURXY
MSPFSGQTDKITRRKASRQALVESRTIFDKSPEKDDKTASLKNHQASAASSAEPAKREEEEPSNSSNEVQGSSCVNGDVAHENGEEAGSSSQPKSSLKARARRRSGTQSSSCTSQDSNASVYGDDDEEEEDEEEPESSCSHDRADGGGGGANLGFRSTTQYEADLNQAGLQLAFDFWRGSDDPMLKKLSEREVQELFAKAPDQLQRLHQQLYANLDPTAASEPNCEQKRPPKSNGNLDENGPTYNDQLSQTTTPDGQMFTPQFINNVASTLGPTLAAALSNLPANQKNGVTVPINPFTGQPITNQEVLNTLAANPSMAPFFNYSNLAGGPPIQQIDPTTVAITNKFVQMARDAHEASASTSSFVHGDQRTVALQTLPDSDYPPFYAFHVAQQHNSQMMFVDQSSQVAYFNFADLPSNKATIQVEDSKPEGTLRLVIQNFSKMTDTVRGPSKIVQNVPWRIMIMPRQHIVQKKGTQKCLGFFLQCCPDAYSDSWSCSAAAELRLISQKQGVPNFSRKTNHNYTSKENDWGYSCFMTWADILDDQQGYIHNDTVILEVHVKAESAKNVMNLDEFRKKITGYIRLAALQCERGLIDKAIECNTMAMKMCKDKDPDCQRKLQAQNAELVARKLKQSIARIERGSDTVAETDPTANITALRIAMSGSGSQRNSAIQKPRRKDQKDFDKKRSKDDAQNDLASNGSVDDNKSKDDTKDSNDLDDEDECFCDNPDHSPKCVCNVEKLDRTAEYQLESLVHRHEADGEECNVLNEFDGKGTFESFEELVANESAASRRLVDALFATPEDKAALLAAVNRARSGVSTALEEADKFRLPMRFELLARSLICDGGFTFADIVQKESDALLTIIAQQAALAAQNDERWRSAIEDMCALAEEDHMQTLPSEPLFELTKSEMAKLQKKICGGGDFNATPKAPHQNVECQTDFPSLSRMKQDQAPNQIPLFIPRTQLASLPTNAFQASLVHSINPIDPYQLQLNAMSNPSPTQVSPRRTLTPRTKKTHKRQNSADNSSLSLSADKNRPLTPEKKENRKRKERPSSVQNDMKENIETPNYANLTPLEAVEMLNQPIASILNQPGPVDNVEVIQSLVKQAYGAPEGTFDTSTNEGLSRYAAQTMEALAKTGNMFAACVLYQQESVKMAGEMKNFTDFGKALEVLTKFCVENKLAHIQQPFNLADAPPAPTQEITSIYQLAQDPEGERKFRASVDARLLSMFYPFKNGPSSLQMVRDVVNFSQKLQNRINELQKDLEAVKNEKKALNKEKNNLQKAEKTMQERTESLKQDNNNLKQQVKNLEKKVSNLQSDRDDELQKVRQQLDHARQEIQDKETQHSRDIQSLNDVKRNYSKELTERQAQIQRLKDQLEEKSNLLKKAETDKKAQRDAHSKLQERARQAEIQNIELKTEHALSKLERARADSEARAKECEVRLGHNDLNEEERSAITKDMETWKKTKAECMKLIDELNKETAKHIEMVKEGKQPSQLPKMNIPKPPPYPVTSPLPPIRLVREPVHPTPMTSAPIPNKFSQPAPNSQQISPPVQLPHHNVPHVQPSAFRSMAAMSGPHPPPFGPNGPVPAPVGAPPFGNGSIHNQHMAPYMNQQRAPNMMFQPNSMQAPIGSRHQQIQEPLINKFEQFEHFPDTNRTPFNPTRSCTPAELEQFEKMRNVRSLWEKDLPSSSASVGGPISTAPVNDPVASVAQSVAQSAKFFPPSNFDFPKPAATNTTEPGVADILRNTWGDSIWSFNNHN